MSISNGRSKPTAWVISFWNRGTWTSLMVAMRRRSARPMLRLLLWLESLHANSAEIDGRFGSARLRACATRRELGRTRTMTRGARHRHVGQLARLIDTSKKKTATTHVAATDELVREE